MPYKDLIEDWNKAVLAIDQKDWESALTILSQVREPTSKIWFNIGCVHLLLGNYNKAIKAFDRTIAKDERLAIGFFQRGVAHLRAEKYEEALSDCRLALVHLRSNTVIDYRQLGLNHKLHAWETLHNRAAVQCHLGLWEEATESLQEAIRLKPEVRPNSLDDMLEKVKKKILLEPLQIPEGRVFRPRAQDVEQLKYMDFLGQPRVISSIIPNDDFAGFEALRPQKPGFYEPGGDSVLGRNSGYYRVLYNFYPKNSSELEVSAGSIVYVLDKGEDGWAVIIHDGQKGLLPTSCLDTRRSSTEENLKTRPFSNGIPLPPTIRPPSRPHFKPKEKPPLPETDSTDSLASSAPSVMGKGSQSASMGTSASSEDFVIVKIHYTFTVAARVNPQISIPDLQALIKQKFKPPQGQLQISFRDLESSELVPLTKEEDLERMWRQVHARRLTLWCKDWEPVAERPILHQMTALYDYIPQGPEDLEFSKGDVLDIVSEVNEEWLEGHCNGNIGIFPKCFAIRTVDGECTLKGRSGAEANS